MYVFLPLPPSEPPPLPVPPPVSAVDFSEDQISLELETGFYNERFFLSTDPKKIQVRPIPLIELESGKEDSTQELVDCLHCHGFALVSLSQETHLDDYRLLLQGSRAASSLFELRREDKIESGLIMSDLCQLGFHFDEQPSKENFTFTLSEDMPPFPEQWTVDVELSIESCFRDYCHCCHNLSVSLLDCLSAAMEWNGTTNIVTGKLSDLILDHHSQSADTFKDGSKRGNEGTECILKLIRYLNAEEANQDGSDGVRFGLGPHFDFGLLTLIQADHFQGLRIYDRSLGEWICGDDVIKASQQGGSLVLLLLPGSQIQWLSEDYLPSTVHCVQQSHSFAERTSLVYFCRANTQPASTLAECNRLYLSRMNDFFKLHPECCLN